MSAPDTSAVVPIPAQLVGKVIGKGGSTIKHLEAEFGCSVNVGKATPGTTTVVVSIRAKQGRRCQVRECVAEVRRLVAPAPGPPVVAADGGVGAGAAGAATAPAPAPAPAVHGVGSGADGDGPPLATPGAGAGAGPGHGPGPVGTGPLAGVGPGPDRVPRITMRLPVPSNCTGRVIGKGGESIRELEARFECRVRVTDPAPGDPPGCKVVAISGEDPAKVDAAVAAARALATKPTWAGRDKGSAAAAAGAGGGGRVGAGPACRQHGAGEDGGPRSGAVDDDDDEDDEEEEDEEDEEDDDEEDGDDHDEGAEDVHVGGEDEDEDGEEVENAAGVGSPPPFLATTGIHVVGGGVGAGAPSTQRELWYVQSRNTFACV
jgi:predicted RNA-binding protein YlqC (UPF0109 family)